MADYKQKAVHFGAGAIGRGFLGELFHNSGYEVVFVDVMDSIIDALQKTPHYTVTEIGADGERSFNIDHYRAINSNTDEPAVVREISTADIVTCAVGPKILKFIAPVIAKGIDGRSAAEHEPLVVIACENAIMATDTLKGFILEKLSADVQANLTARARFANCAIDRIVPHQDADAGINVRIEKFHEWCVESKPFDGMSRPKIEGVHYVDDLTPYIERKLFTVNTGHATAAYYGYARGKATIHAAMADPEINAIVREVLRETAHLVTKKHGISVAEQNEYVEAIIDRISNPALEDKVERVGRAPLRKLGRKERFIAPAAELVENGDSAENLIAALEPALRFQNVPGDDESFELAKSLKEHSAADATTKLTGLEPSHLLFKRVEQIVQKVQNR